MVSRIIPVEPFDLVIVGATGDLARRKLLPALFMRDAAGQVPKEARIIGVSRHPIGDEAFRDSARQALADHLAPDQIADDRMVASFLERLSHVAADANEPAGWKELATSLALGENRNRIFYLAVSPDLYGAISGRIAKSKLVTPTSRVVIEKPIGHDLASAREVNDAVGEVFPERSIYRIDHYLGKEAVQNLMALRFANVLFEPVWNAAHIDHVQITVAESLGVEGRADYYDHAGASRDMVQNHLMQLLCLVAMEPPTSLEADGMRDEKLKVLKSLKPINEGNAAQLTVRGQYRGGAAGGKPAPSYVEEIGHPSSTETFAALKLEIGNWRWAGVPFYLRTGKRLPKRLSEIVIAFRPVPYSVFQPSAGPIAPNRLIISVQPDEEVTLRLMIKDPGPGGMRLQEVPFDMSFAETFHTRSADAYERLVMDVARGDQTLFMRRDEVETAWAWVDPILEAWRADAAGPKPYTAGTWGPSAAIALIERDGRTWHDENG